MNGIDIWGAISLLIIIVIGVLLGRQLSAKVDQYYALPAQPQPTPDMGAAAIVKSAPTTVEEFLDRYPNV